ncbi:MAG: hypothetical protein WD845_08835 [Pirellulales bacterium]
MLTFLCCLAVPLRAADDLGLTVPPGFEVSLYADDTLAHDIYSLTIDAQGRVVVAGAGYVKILHDDDGDGRADRSTLYSSLPASGAKGMVFDGPDLVCTGDDAVLRLRDTDGDGAADGTPEVWTQLRHPEHGANGLVRGPDGCYYLICGNDAGVSAKQITTDCSPVANPRSGAVVRFSSDGQPLDVVAHGFRNPYDLDFNAAGHLFTVDSDGERDHHLPWYAPTRLFDIAPGAEHGWLLMGWTRGWNRPPSYFDSVERLAEIGRGSPTGVVVCRHEAFGPHYQGGVFAACWSLGRVYYLPLEPAGATYRSQVETFVQATGNDGFAPCDLAIGPAGDLFIAIGGRRTQGSVFRVRATDAVPTPGKSSAGEMEQVLAAQQPLTSWSRARWKPLAERLGISAFQSAAEDASLPLDQRVRAIEIVVELCGGPDTVWAARLAQSPHAALRARIAWALGCAAHLSDAQQVLCQLTSAAEPDVARAAWQALLLADDLDPEPSAQPAWTTGLTSEHRRVRSAAVRMAQRAGHHSYQAFRNEQLANAVSSPRDWSRVLADLWIRRPDVTHAAETPFDANDLTSCGQCVLATASSHPQLALEAVRLLQIGLGDLRIQPGQAEVYSGYVGKLTDKIDAGTRNALAADLAPVFPASDAELNRELARLLGMLGADTPGLLPAIAAQWSNTSTVEDDIHYLIVASLLPGRRDANVTAATAQALLRLQPKLASHEQFASRNWPLRVGETFDELCHRDQELAGALVASGDFASVEHTLFAERLPDALQHHAAKKLWSACLTRDDEPSSELVTLVGRLPHDEAYPRLLSAWDYPGLRDPIVRALAKQPLAADRAKFVAALSSADPGTVQRAADALIALGINGAGEELAAALRSLKQACGDAKNPEPSESLVRLLNFWTEENSGVEPETDPAKLWAAWYQMFADYYPGSAPLLQQHSSADSAAWQLRLDAIDWDAGDALRGRSVFQGRTCHRCHEQSGHLGPDLKGAAARLSRNDLFRAIVDPNLEVSPAYQTTLIVTNSGQVYHGLIVYESPETTLLQTAPDTTLRLTNTDQSSVRRGTQSLMPTGLLDPLSDQDLSDLYAYLRTLTTN